MPDDAVPQKPNPGSHDAFAMGCLCPGLDNRYGHAEPPQGWTVTEGCPVHAPRRDAA